MAEAVGREPPGLSNLLYNCSDRSAPLCLSRSGRMLFLLRKCRTALVPVLARVTVSRERANMNRLCIGAVAALAAVGMAVAHADPDPDYTWECDTDDFGHTSCKAVQKPECGEVDGWVVQFPPGRLSQQPYPTDSQGKMAMPAPCVGGPPYFPHAPYPTSEVHWPPPPPTSGPYPVVPGPID
jgi:hypothetical protein